MNKIATKIAMIDALNLLKTDTENVLSGLYQSSGICLYLAQKTDHESAFILPDLFESWKYFSGCRVFPIGDTKDHAYRIWERKKKRVQFSTVDEYTDDHPLWGRKTEYGSLRWNLVDHIIKELEDEQKAYSRRIENPKS